MLLYRRLDYCIRLPLAPIALSIRLACEAVLGGLGGLGGSLRVCIEST